MAPEVTEYKKVTRHSVNMRAEMTVGIDLCSLENLKIFNGHEIVKKEPKVFLDSSPDDRNPDADSDEKQQLQHRNKKGRQKCGRPANPIPRHKRDSHIKAEYKRRDKIQKYFDSLVSLVPELRDSSSSKESKSSMLFKTAEYGRRLKGESGNMQSEMDALRQELEALGTDIHVLQEQLPQQGLDVVEKDPVKMDTLYDQYVQEETKKNWTFWVFGFFMRPLYMSYRQTVSGTTTRSELTKSISDWMQKTLSLTNLRKGFFEVLRTISKQTGIMNQPDQLKEEAIRSVGIHYVQAEPQKPPSSPQTAPNSALTTPIPSPKAPRTPTSQIRSAKRESRKAKESRSRSITPPVEETRQKRRSSHNRKDRKGEDDTTRSGKYSRSSSPKTQSVDTTFSHSFRGQTGLACGPTNNFVPTTLPSSSQSQQMSQPGFDDKDLMKTLTSLLQGTNSMLIKSGTNNMLPNETKILPAYQDVMSMNQTFGNNGLPLSMPMDTQSECPVSCNAQENQTFMLLEQSGIIANGTLIPVEHSRNDSFHEASLPDLPSLLTENSLGCESDSNGLDQLNATVFTSAQPTIFTNQAIVASSIPSIQEPMTTNMQYSKVEASPFMCQDEDSLMNMLTVDVLDVNSVMNFFNEEQPLTMHTESTDRR